MTLTSKQRTRKRQTNCIAPQKIFNLGWNLRFKTPPPDQKAASYFLYFRVTISQNGKSSSEKTSKKTARKPILLHHQSALTRNSKINFIRKERRRDTAEIAPPKRNKHDRTFDDILRINWYPDNFIDKAKRPQNHDPQTSNADWLHFKIPFISDRLDYKITKIFRKEGLPVGSLTNPTL